MKMHWLFLHVLVWCFIVFFSYAEPHLRSVLLMVYLYAFIIYPKELAVGGRDWMRSSTVALPALFIGALWFAGHRQLATWIHYSLCLTVYFQAELGL